MKNLRKIALLAGMLSMSEYGPFKCPDSEYRRYNPDYKVKLANRVLREFTVNGKKVMAYSKKDAIKRLKHS